MLNKLINENLTILTQGIEILGNTPPAVYTAINAETFGSSCGAHFRHLIQHYQAFLTDVCAGHVDYDHRDRTVALETDRSSAVLALQEVKYAFETYDFSERQIKILQNYDPAKPKQPVPSSIARELTFLISHSIHHFAMVGIILRLNGIEVPQYFGFAPSTIYYLNGLTQENKSPTLVNAS